MDCRTTFTKSGGTRQAGLTLVEILVSMAIASMLVATVGSLALFSGRSFAALANYAELENASRNALDRMSREIRQVAELTTFETNRLTFRDFDGGTLEYVYDPNARTLARLKNGNREVLLTECDMLEFGVFQRTPISGSFDQHPTTDPSTGKLIQLSWICSRTIFGKRVNTESVQTAKIVIRNK